jgi:hypothetical protein
VLQGNARSANPYGGFEAVAPDDRRQSTPKLGQAISRLSLEPNRMVAFRAFERFAGFSVSTVFAEKSPGRFS